MKRRHEAGFTLVEVMAAVMVFALISAISVGLLTTALRSKETSEAVMADLAAVQRIQALLSEDIGQMVMRPVRDEDGRRAQTLQDDLDRGLDHLLAPIVQGRPASAGRQRRRKLAVAQFLGRSGT